MRNSENQADWELQGYTHITHDYSHITHDYNHIKEDYNPRF